MGIWRPAYKAFIAVRNNVFPLFLFHKYADPDGVLIRRGVFHPVANVRRDEDVVAWQKLKLPVLKSYDCAALQKQHPLPFLLVVPKAGGAGLSVGDDPFDTAVFVFEERLPYFAFKRVGQLGQNVFLFDHQYCRMAFL